MDRPRRDRLRRRGTIASVALATALIAALGGCGDLIVTRADSGDAATTRTPRAAAGGTPAVVERVVDGDTVIVEVDGERERVRLLNIDTPESVAEGRPIECLGPEASDFLQDLLPEGEEVTLVFDEDRRDQYDRLLAAVFTEDGRNASVEIAAAGLAEAITVPPNDRFRPAVQSAMEDARAEYRGLWDPSGPCAD